MPRRKLNSFHPYIPYPPKADKVRIAVVDAINAHNGRFSLKQLSLGIEKNAAYLQQFLNRGIPKLLHEIERKALSRILEVDDESLMGEDQIRWIGKSTTSRLKKGPDLSFAARDLPIIGTSNGHKAGFVGLGGAMAGFTERPSYFHGVIGAFAVYAPDDSMSPRYNRGDLCYIAPAKPAKAGDDIFIELKNKTGTIRQLVRQSTKTVVVMAHNPKREQTISLSSVKRISHIEGVRFR